MTKAYDQKENVDLRPMGQQFIYDQAKFPFGSNVLGPNENTNLSQINQNISKIENGSPNEDAKLIEVPSQMSFVPEQEALQAKILKLEILESVSLEVNSCFEMNACGLINSKRNASDGCVYAGNLEISPEGKILNDIILSKDEQGTGTQHFIIKYEMSTKNYYLKDLGEGTGTFLKLEKPLPLAQGSIISFADSHMAILIKQPEKIQIKFLEGPKTDQVFTFFDKNEKIKIGRVNDCDIKFDDSALSRYQCQIESKNGEWILYDGNGIKNSTNGTWLFVDEFFEIFDGIIFKAGQTLFKGHLIDQENKSLI